MSDFAWDFPLFAAKETSTDALVGFTGDDGQWHVAIWTDAPAVEEFIAGAGRESYAVLLANPFAVAFVLHHAISLGAVDIIVDPTADEMDGRARYLPFNTFMSADVSRCVANIRASILTEQN
jgi:hypothetical protein